MRSENSLAGEDERWAAVPLQVTALTRESTDVVSLELRDPDGRALPAFEPGAHVDVHLPDGEVRQYSLCGDAADLGAYRIAIQRHASGRVSRFLNEQVTCGSMLAVGKPRNHFRLEMAPRLIFIAGGIGITPVLSMLHAVECDSVDWHLHYCVRDADDAAFAVALAGFGNERVTLYGGRQGRRLAVRELFGAAKDAPDTLIYCCGPKRLMNAVENASVGAFADRVRFESFLPSAPAADSEAQSFEVFCARSGKTVWVPPEKSILNVLDECGVRVRRSCRQGVCKTCEVKVLGGEPDHRDKVLTPAERAQNDRMMVCVSRSKSSRLTIDV
jgi:ferredoxin-NADP reductase